MLLGNFFTQKIIIRNCRKMSYWVEEKARYLNRSLDERLENGAITLADVPSWTQYYNSNKESLADRPVQNLKGRFNIEDYTPKPELNSLVSVWRGDITKLAIDTIVNAANNRMLGGGGVDGAIHRAAGPLLKEECATHNGCPTGQAKITGAYKLPSKYIIHTVGPVGEKPDLLVSSYKTSLELAVENQLRTIAFPCISTGVYGYPQSNAAVTVLKFTREFLETNPSKLDRIIFCVFLPEDVEIYESLLQVYFPVPF